MDLINVGRFSYLERIEQRNSLNNGAVLILGIVQLFFLL